MTASMLVGPLKRGNMGIHIAVVVGNMHGPQTITQFNYTPVLIDALDVRMTGIPTHLKQRMINVIGKVQ